MLCYLGDNSVKSYALTEIKCENKFFIHINRGSFFERQGADKYFTLAQGREWRGGEVFDDFC